MEFKDGASIYTSDGKAAGNLHRVVIDPETNEVTHIVIQKGLLAKEDKVVNVEKVAGASQEKVTLNCIVDELKEMSPLDVAQYTPIEGTSGQGRNYDPLTGQVSLTERSVITEIKRTIPDELVALKERARVISDDDDTVGNIERVFTEPETGKVMGFIVSQGLLLKTRKSIPIEWVKTLRDDQVRLAVGTQQLEELPPLGEGFSD